MTIIGVDGWTSYRYMCSFGEEVAFSRNFIWVKVKEEKILVLLLFMSFSWL